MNKRLLALSIAFASALSTGFAKDPGMIQMLPMVVAPHQDMAPVALVGPGDTDSAAAATFSQVAEDLETYDLEHAGFELTATSPNEIPAAADFAETDLATLYVHAVKAQRAAHVRAIRLALMDAAKHKLGFLEIAEAQFEATHPRTPAARELPEMNLAAATPTEAPSAFAPGAPTLESVLQTPVSGDLVATPEPPSAALFFVGAGLMLCFVRRGRTARPAQVPVPVKNNPVRPVK
jgi:hypothetical protein